MHGQQTIDQLIQWEREGLDPLAELARNNIECKVVREKNVVILNYLQIPTNHASPFVKDHPVVRECRALILRKLEEGWRVIAWSFDRFFNLGEHENETRAMSAAIDTPGHPVVAYEKLDGSLITVVHFDEEWHVFTRRGNADGAPFRGMRAMPGQKPTFGEIVRRLIRWERMKPEIVYVLELCSFHENVTRYGSQFLALLTGHPQGSDDELDDLTLDEMAAEHGWRRPERFPVESMAQLRAKLREQPPDFEGFVLRHGHQRMKMKQDSYLRLHHLASGVSLPDLARTVVIGEADELKLVREIDPETVEGMRRCLEDDLEAARALWDAHGHLDRRAFAPKVLRHPYGYLLFRIHDGKLEPTEMRCPWRHVNESEQEKEIKKMTDVLVRRRAAAIKKEGTASSPGNASACSARSR